MKNYIRKTIIGALIVGGSLFLVPDKTNGLEQIVNEIKIEKKEERSYKLNTNILFNEIVRGASFKIETNKNRFIDDKEIGLVDKLTISYDYAALSKDYSDLLNKTDKEKNLWNIAYNMSYKKIPFIDISYLSDKSIKTYSTLLIGGLDKQFFDRFKVGGGLGFKMGNVDFKKENYNVMNVLLGYVTPNKGDYKLDASVKAYLPRKYLTDKSLQGLWMVDGNATMAINKKIFGVMPTFSVGCRRDYIPLKDGSYEEILRYNIGLGFSFESGGAK